MRSRRPSVYFNLLLSGVEYIQQVRVLLDSIVGLQVLRQRLLLDEDLSADATLVSGQEVLVELVRRAETEAAVVAEGVRVLGLLVPTEILLHLELLMALALELLSLSSNHSQIWT